MKFLMVALSSEVLSFSKGSYTEPIFIFYSEGVVAEAEVVAYSTIPFFR